ncbi:tRNA (guanine-N(7)-)-methyltransferase [Brucella suis 63/252]|uniref:tRNA (guanine-N(7)-)-methyltransferase n=2 Tax=Brucella TaxID=234 RepID=A9M9Z0_BRUC2|nr:MULTISPECIES: tRNA (guanosine(46)-N(7))-methyltransferase TrmB [Brucella]KEX99079.1 tRNA (guanine-N7)-methyltransferase [Brucella inopinata BO1]ABX63185.1 tRNA (guanine-N(7)-)-methyltransferase [Brucella canis ATCC 23365]AEW14115.1 tRNA (guanine-N(7)-)-methyltransferase [Brucella canis HSK A52141]AHZ82267.1 tRNA (guanine-N7)-methyltransferase [Brucella canis]AIJ71656.1 methyltransferase family protein [Brucella suis bv. 3 str. 686]
MIDENHPMRAAGNFFGRRHGKPLRPHQSNLFEDLLPRLKLDLATPASQDLRSLFEAPVETVRMEIGFGGGEHLHHESGRYPQSGFIGVEPFINGMAKMLAALDQAPRPNLRLYDEDATAVLDWLPDASLAGIDLFYPDPWHKRRHWKRRFVSDANLDRFARVLKPGAKFRFASDIEHYVNWTLQHCRRHAAFDWQAESPADWNDAYEGWPGTRYEAKAFREGRRAAYLTFIRR